MDNSIQLHQKELCNKLWSMANALRGSMEAYEFKNYILGIDTDSDSCISDTPMTLYMLGRV